MELIVILWIFISKSAFINTNISLKILDELQISYEKKEFLRDFANSLMKRNI